ncbi:MAG TPA: hypothetical protein VJ439_00975 [Candidatus Bathyarchaeia archaeon]|nr:hypothetical protein [Candidatus Bathyarchaeia archaeon]
MFDLIRCSFPLAIGLIALAFYNNKRKSGFLMISVAFFVNAISAVLLGSTVAHYLLENEGFEAYSYSLYCSVLGFGFAIIFTILVAIGLFMLYKEII